MLRLAPSCAPLWRTPSSLQLGTAGTVQVDEVAPWQETLLSALYDGVPDAMVLPLARHSGAADAEAEEFLERISPALRVHTARTAEVRVELPPELSSGEEEALLGGLRAAEVSVTEVTRWPVDDSRRLPVLVVAPLLVDPRRVARLVAGDVPHLVWELAGDEVTVGPLVVPGAGACVACGHAHRRDADPQWPLLASQLLAAAPFRTATGLLWESALLAARLLTAGIEGAASTSVTINAGNARRLWMTHRPHPQCLCRSPAGNASAAGDGPPPPPTTSEGLARPA